MSLRRISRVAILLGSVAAVAVPVAAAEASTGGSVTVSLTQPVTRTVTHSANVTCGVNGTTFHAAAERKIGNYEIAVTDVVADYNGSGTYSSTGRVSVEYLPTGLIRTKSHKAQVTLDADTDTGTVPFSVTFPGTHAPRLTGRTVAGSIGWSCAS